MKILEIKNLNIFYGSIHAIKDISFYIEKGEVVSLIGSNGAGKTSALQAISGLIESRGEILLESKSVQAYKAHDRVKLGLSQSPEGRGVFPTMSVYENLLMGAYIKSDKKEISQDIEICYELFPRLKERAKQVAGTMSGGEQQMLAISRALMSRPKVLLLDEPSLGLAPKIVSQIFEIILKLNNQGMTILLVEQNAKQALKVSNRAYVLETGKITLTGKGSDLLNDDNVRRSYLGI